MLENITDGQEECVWFEEKFKWLSSIWRHTLCARHYLTFAKEGKIKRILLGIINYWNYKINVMYDIAELLLAVATQNNIMRTENRTWLWFESQYAGNVEALVAVGWKCSLSQTWHASGARLQCVFMAGGRMVVANYCSVCGDLGKVIFLFFFLYSWYCYWSVRGLEGVEQVWAEQEYQTSSWLRRTQRATFRRKSARLLRHSFCKQRQQRSSFLKAFIIIDLVDFMCEYQFLKE